MTTLKDIEADIYFLTAQEGGRSKPAFDGYRPQFYYDGQDWDACQSYPDMKQVNPGDTVRTYLAFLSPDEHFGKVYVGMEFLIREGTRTVAKGVVTKILDLEESANRVKIERLVKNITVNEKGSDFEKLSIHQLDGILEKYPNIPKSLLMLYKTIGIGCIGESKYMIHYPTEPKEIYDKETSADLKNIIVVGDDFSGTCEAYKMDSNGWIFGYIYLGEFVEHDKAYSFVEFLNNWFSVH